MTKQKIALRRAHNRPQGLDPVERINAITRNARASWAGLVAVLLFVGVTLLGFEHIDFYGIDEQTTLPVVGVSVPTRFFFYAAPVLAAASYIYFHLYLLRLWSALATAPARIKGAPLSDATPVWLLLDAALWLRNLVRRDGSSGERALAGISALVNIALAWGFGLVVVGYAWWISATARDLWMTGLTALMWLAMIATAISSLGTLWRRVAHNRPPRPAHIATAIFVLCAPLLAFPTYWRTTDPAPWLPRPGHTDTLTLIAEDFGLPVPWHDPFTKLAPINLIGAEIVRKPDDWLPHDIQMDEFRVDYCKRKAITPCTFESDAQEAFEAEWQTRWQARLDALPKPKWHNPGQAKPDLRQANLADSFLAGIDLNNAQMQGVVLREAQMQGAVLSRAQMRGADLIRAQMQGVVLREAQMQGALLSEAQMQGADLSGAKMQGAELSGAQMQGADLSGAQMQGVVLSGAQLQGADLSVTKMQGALLSRTQMQGAKLHNALFTGSAESSIATIDTNLRASINNGGALRFVDLSDAEFDSETDWRNAFLDGSVTLPDGFRSAMGTPCQWVNDPLSDQEFYGRWRGWVEADDPILGWSYAAPPEWRDVTPIPPPEGCKWKTGPMPGAASK